MSVSWVYQENVCHQNYIMPNLLVKNIWKSYIWTADKDVNESDPRSDVHYLGSSENKAWKACTGFEPMTSAIPVQRSTNWANKPTGSWSWWWF